MRYQQDMKGVAVDVAKIMKPAIFACILFGNPLTIYALEFSHQRFRLVDVIANRPGTGKAWEMV